VEDLWAKSGRSGVPGESLIDHLAATRTAAEALAGRIDNAGVLADWPQFWAWVVWAALLHDAGKAASGFQQMLRGGEPWGYRHEVLSGGVVADVLAAADPDTRRMVATGVLMHHRPLTTRPGGGAGRTLWNRHGGDLSDYRDQFGAEVPARRYVELVAWLRGHAPDSIPWRPAADRLYERAWRTFHSVAEYWQPGVDPVEALVAVLLQGAVTLADHLSSAHAGGLSRPMPLNSKYLTDRVVAAGLSPHAHQVAAAHTDGHLLLLAPTGSGKTEAGLAWAGAQIDAMAGQARVWWVLPYRVSIDAMVQRLSRELADPALGRPAEIGLLHATAAQTLLGWATEEDGSGPDRASARKARARAGLSRLFVDRIRVATPYQLLRGALAGPKYSSVLMEQANAVYVLDELHAYDTRRFGWLCAAMGLWEQLGGRVAVTTATLGAPVTRLVQDSLRAPVQNLRAQDPGPTRLRLAVDPEPVESPATLARIRSWLADGHAVLVVANSVTGAQDVFELLAPPAETVHGPQGAVLLHSRFRQRDRRRKEAAVQARYPERGPAIGHHGGLVVSTQVLEVSLGLDFDRGVSEIAPVEALVQRMGRVNRMAHHPERVVEFRVHNTAGRSVYDPQALSLAWAALGAYHDHEVGEADFQRWLDEVYASPYGAAWVQAARVAREQFRASFLTFTPPFEDRAWLEEAFDEQFDGVDVVLAADLAEYRRLATDEDPLLAADLTISLQWRQVAALRANGAAWKDDGLRLWVIDAPYDDRLGLSLRRGPPR
jgi:CRISPR-associated endonuclease/helicase Cas3